MLRRDAEMRFSPFGGAWGEGEAWGEGAAWRGARAAQPREPLRKNCICFAMLTA